MKPLWVCPRCGRQFVSPNFRLARSEDLDEALVALLHEAYVLGCEVVPRRR